MPSTSTVHSSQLLSAAKQAGQPDAYTGHRLHTRYALGMHVELSTDPEHGEPQGQVLVHNVSVGGVGVWSKQQYAEGTEISIRDGDGSDWLAGTVRHMSTGVHGFLIGIKFHGGIQADGAVETGPEGSSESGKGGSKSTANVKSDNIDSDNAEGVIPVTRLCAPLVLARIAKGGLTGAIIAGAVFLGLRFLDFELFADEIAIGSAGAVIIGVGSGLIGFRRERRFLRGVCAAIESLCQEHQVASWTSPPSRTHAAIIEALQKLAHHQRRQAADNLVQRQHNAELQAVKSGILTIVSQDVCRPLQAIQQHVEVLREEVDSLSSERRSEMIEIIARQSASVAHQVGDLRELQHLDNDPQDDPRMGQSCDPGEVLQAVAKAFELTAQSRKLALELRCDPDLPPVLVGSEKLSRVLKRIVFSAIKHSPDGGTVTVDVRERACELVFSVEDCGPGIPRERWGMAFDQFQECEALTEGEDPADRLGLYIARRIVEAHQGRIWVDSEPGSGAVVCFAIPTSEAPEDELPAVDALTDGLRVVVCDSDPELAAMMSQALRSRRYQVSIAHSGQRLLEILDHEPVDVVLTDVQLPDLSTSDLLGALRNRSEQNFATVLHSFEDRLRFSAQQIAVAYLRRPVDRAKLYQAVDLAAKKRLLGGKTVLLLEHGSIETKRLRSALEAEGHVVLSCVSVKELARSVESYQCDLMLLPQATVDAKWGEISTIGSSGPGNVQRMILVDDIRRRESTWDEQLRAWSVEYRPGFERNVLDCFDKGLQRGPVPNEYEEPVLETASVG